MAAKQNRTPWILVGLLGCLALCLLMVLMSGGTYLLVSRNQTTPVARSIETPTLGKSPPPIAPSLTPSSLTSPPPIVSSPTIATQVPTSTPGSSNGKIAFVSERDGGGAIYLMNADGSQQTRVSGDLRMSAGPRWSPNSKQILFATFAPASPGSDYFLPSLVRMNSDGSEQTRLGATIEGPSMPAWSPDGARITFVGNSGQLYLMQADGSNVILLSKSAKGVQAPAWSPDGKRIAYKALVNGTSEVCIINVDGSQEKCVTNHASFKTRQISQDDDLPVWSPDGKRIAFASMRTSFKYDIHVMNADGSQRTNLTNKPAFYGIPAWSPDGEHIVFSSDQEATSHEIYTMNSDGTDLKRLTNNPGWDGNPAWSPDGKRIVFDSNKPGKLDQDIYVINADGTGLTPLTNNPGADKNPVWQPPNR